MIKFKQNVMRATGFAVAGMLAMSAGAQQKEKPNFLFILTDDQGWSDLSAPLDPNAPDAYCKVFNTPNMNKLVDEGMRFTDAYASAPICTPSRRSIQFGMTPARQHGTEFVGEFDPTGKWSIAQALKQADSRYKCAHFGKWGKEITGHPKDNASCQPGSPANLGYDQSDGLNGNWTGGCYRWYKQNITLEANPDPKRTFSLTDRSIEFMRQQVEQKNPFYLQVGFFLQCIKSFRQGGKPLIAMLTSPLLTEKFSKGFPPCWTILTRPSDSS